MLGKTQFPWLERVLDDAQKQAVTWKIVAISSPIDHVGPFGLIFPCDGPKTSIGGYRAERTRMLKYIVDNRIDHVVLLTTDDHLNRVLGLSYLAEPGNEKTRTRSPEHSRSLPGPSGR